MEHAADMLQQQTTVNRTVDKRCNRSSSGDQSHDWSLLLCIYLWYRLTKNLSQVYEPYMAEYRGRLVGREVSNRCKSRYSFFGSGIQPMPRGVAMQYTNH